MSNRCYHVIFTGTLLPGMDRKTVMSNLVLVVGLPEKKAVSLLDKEQVLLKRFEYEVDAKRLADKFQQAGMHCVVDERGRGGTSGDSILMSIFNKFSRSSDKS